MRLKLSWIVLTALILVASCTGIRSIAPEDVAGTPTQYATVSAPPDPALMGHWRRPQPGNLERPWLFQYCLVKKGDKYAVYYYYDSHKKNSFKGWASFSIDGSRMTSGVDGVVFYAKDGKVFMIWPGRDDHYPMEKLD
ncbi:hypothetical protein NNJEOMEG_01602 [Fundidesulfovibrio magnetotacticus]|uniref:Lipoprotein n=1 Tax=Fundidesulfovibrio magnetotacticus TaxID=2730080 RepID=A0A6V8LTW6_9BACT|nr:hypothetical protein [Fundidesulfovibrio magnetotacticus]GFK93768.1 hypothetical protein NNJEOMEG_01602 [Fundidesulfovibrio magnetotacticus]